MCLFSVRVLLVIYRNADNLCEFILYPVTLLKLLFQLDSLGFPKYIIISPAKSDSLVSSLLILIPSISFSSHIAKANVSSTILQNSGDNGHCCFTPILLEIHLAYPHYV